MIVLLNDQEIGCDLDTIDACKDSPDAFYLLHWLALNTPGGEVVKVDEGIARRLGWACSRLFAARDYLIGIDELSGPGLYHSWPE